MNIRKLIPDFLIRHYHLFLAFLGACFFGFPSKKIKVIGITGTNGKSSAVLMISKVLRRAGYKTACVSSIEIDINGVVDENATRMTMPGRFFIQKFLAKAVKAKCDYAIIEVTSQGIEQSRHRFIDFEIAAITNLSPEHIEAHKGFDNYRKAKGKFFSYVKKTHILNFDDPYFEYFNSFEADQKFCYGFKKDYFDSFFKIVKAKNISREEGKIIFNVENQEFLLNLLGDFNVYNALIAICVGMNQGIDLKTMALALLEIDLIPGRMEKIVSKPFEVVIDYAVTPDALENLYKNFQGKDIIEVFGACGGGRDKWKRKILGEIASKYCKYIVLTDEDPYYENQEEIINQISKGIPLEKEYSVFKIIDRKEAIKKAISLAQPGNVVIISGKGSEPSICIKGKKISWSDKGIALELIKKNEYR